MPFGMAKLVGGICFSLGLILCVVCGADLFTSTVLIVVAKASGRITWGQLAKNWLNVYFGNLVGALLFVLLMWLSGEYMTANGQWGLNVLQPPTTKCTILLLRPSAWYPGKPDGMSGSMDELFWP